MKYQELIVDDINDLYLLLDSVQYASINVGEAYPQYREFTLLLSRTLGDAPRTTYSMQTTKEFTDIETPNEVYKAIVYLKENAERLCEQHIDLTESEIELCRKIISMADEADILSRQLQL